MRGERGADTIFRTATSPFLFPAVSLSLSLSRSKDSLILLNRSLPPLTASKIDLGLEVF